MIEPQMQQLLDVKDRIIEQQQEQIVLLGELAEQRRLAFLHQCNELAQHRRFDAARNNLFGFFFFCFLRDVWPFKLFWKYNF
jgi:hypothetical protein